LTCSVCLLYKFTILEHPQKHPAYAGAFTYGRTRTVRTGRVRGRANVPLRPVVIKKAYVVK